MRSNGVQTYQEYESIVSPEEDAKGAYRHVTMGSLFKKH